MMVNVEFAAEHDCGRMFHTPLKTMCTTFKYGYKHNTTSLKQVLDLLATSYTDKKHA